MKVKVADVLLLGLADWPVIVVCGATVSTVNERTAGLGSVLPAASVARTSKVCGPSASGDVVCGEAQAAKGAAPRRHSSVAPGSLENEKVGIGSLVGPSGPESIVVSGATVSTVQVWVAGLCSTLPARSIERT